MEDQEIDVMTFFYERGKSIADYLRKESAHIVIPKDVGLNKLKTIFSKFFCWGNRGGLFCEVI